MGFRASHIATVPSAGFNWYLIFLEGSLRDPVKREIDDHFDELGRKSGRSTVVIRGYDADSFRESVYALNPEWRARAKFPALLVTDKPPAEATRKPGSVDDARVFLFSLEEIYSKDQTLATFLAKLLETLNEPEAVEALEKMERRQQRKQRWGWLNNYLMLEPNFQGFGVRGNQVLKDIAGL
jgi:hypothetical protein